MQKYLEESRILNYSHNTIQSLINKRAWKELDEINRVKSIYNFVRDEILFGYNSSDDIQASDVLSDGFGQCNTKSSLLMALLRAVSIPNRIHGFTIDKALQKGALSGIWYKLAPSNILHSWVEVFIHDRWYNLEGVILDKIYLQALQDKFKDNSSTFCGFGVYTDNFQQPQIDWNMNNTYIQEKGINQDFGLFDTPDQFYKKHQQKLNFVKSFFFKNLVRKIMNKNVNNIRRMKI